MRASYTGEPRAAALHFYRRAGLRFGLVPDTSDAGQQRLEALLLQTLAHPHPYFPQLVVPGSVWGLFGASPYPDRITLWPAPGQAAGLLARWLPIRTPEGELGGVPGLRAATLPARRDTLTLALAGRRAHVEVRTEPRILEEAAELARGAGLEVLWEADAASRAESEALGALVSELSLGRSALWSRALRRLGVARDVFEAWRGREPLESELEGPAPARIAPRPAGQGVALRGVVAVLSGDGRGGRGCTTAAYMLAAGAAVGGARVGFLTGDDPSNLPALLGMDRAPAGAWRDAGGQLGAGCRLEAAVLPTDAAGAENLLAAARKEFDAVVVDAGTPFQPPLLADQADATLVLVPDQVAWYDDEVIDERSARAQIWSHLQDLNRQGWPSRAPGPELFVFLDEVFVRYVEWRAAQEGMNLPQEETGRDYYADLDSCGIVSFLAKYTAGPGSVVGAQDCDDGRGLGTDGEADVDEGGGRVEPYDPGAVDDVEMFWSQSVGGSAWAMLPPEESVPCLDTWRSQFVEALTPEGRRRHPDTWPDVLANWAGRNRERNLQRVAPGDLTAAQETAAEQHIVTAHTEEARGRWGEDLWRHESAAWLAAGGGQRNETSNAENDQLFTLHHPRPPQKVAAELRLLARHAPLGRPTVLVVSQPRQDLDRHLLEKVELSLQQEPGTGALTVIPRREALTTWVHGDRIDAPALMIGLMLTAAVRRTLERRL
ncbi:hypothetical protein AB0J01_37990 [Streptomyces sp. NPDC050204]|uniref:hypothetical protein n=1 Tax=Streptomyces sp. NPDC050204 TaxID=3155514 RepID=UPI00343BEC12